MTFVFLIILHLIATDVDLILHLVVDQRPDSLPAGFKMEFGDEYVEMGLEDAKNPIDELNTALAEIWTIPHSQIEINLVALLNAP